MGNILETISGLFVWQEYRSKRSKVPKSIIARIINNRRGTRERVYNVPIVTIIHRQSQRDRPTAAPQRPRQRENRGFEAGESSRTTGATAAVSDQGCLLKTFLRHR